MRPRVGLSGSLRDLPLTELLFFLAGTRQGGTLEFSGATAGLLVLDHGAVTLALTDEGPSLPQVLIGSGVATSDGWERAHLASLQGTSLADALIEAGADAERLEAVLREQTVSTVFELLLPSDTQFAFLPGTAHPLGGRFRFEANDLLVEARRRVDAWKVIAEAIPSTAMVMRVRRELADPTITIAADDWRVLARVDGHATIADVIRSLGMSAFAVCGVLHRLLLIGAVEAASPE